VHREWLIFAERSVEVQSETIQPNEVRRNPAGHLIEAGWTWQRVGNAMRKSWDNTSVGRLTLSDGTLKLESIRPKDQTDFGCGPQANLGRPYIVSIRRSDVRADALQARRSVELRQIRSTKRPQATVQHAPQFVHRACGHMRAAKRACSAWSMRVMNSSRFMRINCSWSPASK